MKYIDVPTTLTVEPFGDFSFGNPVFNNLMKAAIEPDRAPLFQYPFIVLNPNVPGGITDPTRVPHVGDQIPELAAGNGEK